MLSTSNSRSEKTAEVNAGGIFWLPAVEACMEHPNVFLDPNLDPRCFNHPVLVLRKSHKQDTALVLIVRLDAPPPLSDQEEASSNLRVLTTF